MIWIIVVGVIMVTLVSISFKTHMSMNRKPKPIIEVKPEPELTPWSTQILARYNKLPNALKTVDIVPLLKSTDATILDLPAAHAHWLDYHRWSGLRYCGAGPFGRLDSSLDIEKCKVVSIHNDIIATIADLEEEAKHRDRSERMLVAAYDTERAGSIIEELEAEIRISKEVRQEVDKTL